MRFSIISTTFRWPTKEWHLPWLKTGQPFAVFVLVQRANFSRVPRESGQDNLTVGTRFCRMTTEASAPAAVERRIAEGAAFSIILALSFSHLLNDMMQSLVPALYPMIKGSYGLSFVQIGLMTTAMQVTSSMLQPIVGLAADHKPQPYSLSVGMGATLIGVLMLGEGRELSHSAPAGLGAGRHRLGGVSPRSVARGAHGLGRAAWARAIAVPGRRQCRLGLGADPRGVDRDSQGPGQRCLVLVRGVAGDDRTVPRRQLVSARAQPARRAALPGKAPRCRT